MDAGCAAVKGVFLALKKSAETWTAHVCGDGEYFEPTRPVVREGVTVTQALSWLCAAARHAQARGAGVLGVGLVPSVSLGGGMFLVVRDDSQSTDEPSDGMRAEMLPEHAPLVWMMAGATARIRLAPVTLFERAMPALGFEAALLLPAGDTASKVWTGVIQLSSSLALPLALPLASSTMPFLSLTTLPSMATQHRIDVGVFWFKLGAFSVYHYKKPDTGESLQTDLGIVPLLELTAAGGHIWQCVLPAPLDNHFRPFLLSYTSKDADSMAAAPRVVQEAAALLSHMCAGVAAHMDAPAHTAAAQDGQRANHVSFDDPRFPHARLQAELQKLLESVPLGPESVLAVAAATDAASSAVDLTRLARGVLRAVAARVQAGKHKAEDAWRYAATASFDLLLMAPVAFEDVPPAWLPSSWNVTISDSVFTNALSVLLFRAALSCAVQAARECRFPGITCTLEATMRAGVLLYPQQQQQQASSRAVALRRRTPDGTPVFFFDPTTLALGAPGLPPVHCAPVNLQVQPACERNKVLGFFEAHATMLIAEEVAPLDARNAACAIAAMLVKRQGQQRLGHVYTELQAWMRDVRALTPAASSVSEKKRKRAR